MPDGVVRGTVVAIMLMAFGRARVSVLQRKAHFVAVCLALSALLAVAGAVVAGPAVAAVSTRYVAPTGEDSDNDCTVSASPCQTIQYAVDQANAGDSISIARGTYGESVQIHKSLTLVGSGATGSGRSTIDGDGSDPSIFVDGFDTNSPPDVTVEDLDVSGNQADDGILVDGGSLTVRASRVSTNQDNGIDVDGPSTAHVTGSTVNGNGQDGVHVDNPNDETSAPTVIVALSTVDRNGDGGVIVYQGEADVTSSTLGSNFGAGMVLAGGETSGSLTTSTVSNTVPITNAGGDPFGGGVLVFPGGGVTIDTSTIYRNTGQGVLSYVGSVTTIENSTISGTRRPASGNTLPAGGIAVATNPNAPAQVDDSSAALTVTGTIVADNTSIDDCSGAVTDDGYNLDSDGSCAWTTTHSISNGHAKLGPLADNTGPTETLLPAKGSDAIDAIPTGSANCTKSAKDQRGVSRPQRSRCDIGAVEVRPAPQISARVTSRHGTRHGWYRTPVTVHFTCITHGATLTRPCPSAVTLSHSAGGQSVTRRITATDGGTDTVRVRRLNIDRVKPHVRVTGVHDGAVYTGTPPRPRCVARDALSGVASCHVAVHKHGRRFVYRAVATDRAGNKRTVSGSYRMS
jgi:hypothetical protein